jgi:hypothetical protein
MLKCDELRAEVLLQLRCIEIDGDWSAFTDFVQAEPWKESSRPRGDPRLLRTKAQPLPSLAVAA